MKKILVVLSILLIPLINNAYCQESFNKGKWSGKVGYARYYNGGLQNGTKKTRDGNIRMEVSYGISDYIETGIYIGGFITEVMSQYSDGTYYLEDKRVFSYGINANFKILPLLIKNDDLKIDIYFSGKYGFRSMIVPTDYYKGKVNPEYAIGCGVAYYPWRHIGLYVEFGFGKYEYGTYSDRFESRYGLSFKF